MVYTASEAADQLEADGVSVEIVDLRSVLPWDKEAVLESVRKTSKVLVLHEDTHTGGFGAEIAATIAEEAFEDLDAPVRRITAPDSPVPFSPPLEKAFIPQVDDVVARVARARGVLGDDGDADTQVDVVMPQMGVSVSEGTITKWLKQPGEPIAPTSRCSRSRPTRSTPRCRARAPASLQQILVQEGETVEVGTQAGRDRAGGRRRPEARRAAASRSPRLRRAARGPPHFAPPRAAARARRASAGTAPAPVPATATAISEREASSRRSSRGSRPSTASTSGQVAGHRRAAAA